MEYRGSGVDKKPHPIQFKPGLLYFLARPSWHGQTEWNINQSSKFTTSMYHVFLEDFGSAQYEYVEHLAHLVAVAGLQALTIRRSVG